MEKLLNRAVPGWDDEGKEGAGKGKGIIWSLEGLQWNLKDKDISSIRAYT